MMKKSSDYGWNHPIDPAWERAEYDGIMGFPPEWVPEPRMREFCIDRGCLFFDVDQEKITYAEIKSRFNWMMNDKDAAMKMTLFADARTEYDDSLSFLVWLFKAVSLGETECLRRLGGDTAVIGAKSKNGYKTRADQIDKAHFQEIAQPLLKKNNNIIDKTLKEPTLKAYVNKWSTNAVRGWLREIRPAGVKQIGRPKKT
ncbi:MAG: hypothetical protein U1C48_03965 [Methylotenera sp.]|nr:hypothetical protein [Methylotenera sp.]